MIEIKKVESKKQLDTFLKLPWSLYKDAPHWVPPLLADQKELLDQKKNLFFQHSDADLFLAYQDGKAVGRISAAKSHIHLDIHDDGRAFFGFFECTNDHKVADALLNTVSEWAKEKGLKYLRGPLSFTMNDDAGLLIEGFDLPPSVGMPYHLPYYKNLLEQFGFEKSQDLFAYKMDVATKISPQLEAGIKLILEEPGLEIRRASLDDFDLEVEIMSKIYNEAWKDNWGFMPLEAEEIKAHAKKMKSFINPDLIYGAYYEGKPVGYSFALPDLNQVIKSANGKLFPFGVLKILLNKHKIDHFRVLISGVLKEYQRTGIQGALLYKTWKGAKKHGLKMGEISWVLESNTGANEALDKLGAEIYKRYRIFDYKIQ